MTPEEEKQIEQWGRNLRHEITIDLTLTSDERSSAFKTFGDQLVQLVPKIHVKIEREDLTSPPLIQVGNVTYQALPSAKELQPFLDLLSGAGNTTDQLPASLQKQLSKIEIPAPLKIYITPFCPFCPVAVAQLISLAAGNEFIKLAVIDGAMFPEMAQSDQIQSAPTVLLDDQYRWTGSINLQELVDIILNRDPARLSAVTLENMFAQGDAVRVAEMMLDSAEIFPAFPELLVHKKWPVRLGAMVAFETLVVRNSQLAVQVVPVLWKQFFQVKDAVKGDILYLLGISGNTEMIPELEKVVSGPYHAEVKEAAVDALKELHPKAAYTDGGGEAQR